MPQYQGAGGAKGGSTNYRVLNGKVLGQRKRPAFPSPAPVPTIDVWHPLVCGLRMALLLHMFSEEDILADYIYEEGAQVAPTIF